MNLNKWGKAILPSLIGVLLLAGCGTAEQSDDKVNGGQTTNPTPKTAQTENTDKSSGDSATEQKNEQLLTYTVNGEQKEESAKLVNSDNQGYSMYVLPEFELTAEEPNKDVLFLKDNDKISMRIEILPADSDMEQLKENTKAQLGAVNGDIKDLQASNDQQWLADASIMQAENTSDQVTAYIVKKDDSIVKMTIFSKKDADYNDAFVKMAETIKKK